MRIIVFIALFTATLTTIGQSIDTLYILHDSLEFQGVNTIPSIGFYSDSSGDERIDHLRFEPNENFEITIINNDSIDHIIGIDSYANVASGDTLTLNFQFANESVLILHDSLDFPSWSNTGLSCMISIVESSSHLYTWNLRTHELSKNSSVLLNQGSSWMDYAPDYFTINGQSHPHIENDTNVKIVGNVGDTIVVDIASTTMSHHSMHFHGYHAAILYSSYNSTHVGRSKDTFPIKGFETLRLRLIPDQPGVYPVHDHNLTAVSGGGIYPYGMLTTLNISP